ncbi:hypothetical protein SPSIL_057940 [Sporomusa silvacetica DSM 10669]|uniref:Zinc-ribbon domain-containing protein n=1 Tax=Sporomusa silvacetica DSM 10669 TaxID=1123289 RepID=A0ABZ3IVF3_9FIRM|nr:zinc-ribbon domain-containing protein [Sporomusa silvacetica]OZC14258.1 hypothetical protein SPSIL_49850 [Sporomusa silvacetica DSM 10669]
MAKICKQCSTELEASAKLCPKCGTNQEQIGQVVLSNHTDMVPTVEVLRESSFVGCLLSYRVFVDNKEIGRLKNGEKKRFQLKPGLHEMYIKVNWSWFSSPKESFLLKDFVKFSCKPKVGFFGSVIKIPYYSLFKRHKFVSLKES